MFGVTEELKELGPTDVSANLSAFGGWLDYWTGFRKID